MLQNAESAQPVQKISRIETILMPPVADKAGKPTGGKFRVDGMVGGKHYEITPTRNWNEMTVFDNAHQIETSKGKMALSDFLLKNVRGLTQLAIDQGFVKSEDADVGIPIIGADNKPMENAVEHPLNFLKGKNGELTVPKNLSLEQTQNLMLLIFEKTKNTPDFAERDNKNGLTKILLEQIRNNYNKLGEAGKVPDDPQNPSGIFTEEPVFEALNIACRKAVEARLEEQAYRKTKTFERKGESRKQRLLNRLSIAAGIVDESTGGTARKQITELQDIHQRDAKGEKTPSLEFSVQMDMFMAQAFDILVPAEVRVQMKKAQIEIDNTTDYKKKADLIQVANKEKQMWRMAILNHFQVERTLPSKTKIPSIADEIRNPKIFSWEERMKIENDYTNSIANEISSLEKSRKDQGGLAELDLSSVNLIKTEQLLEQILPKTGRPEQRAKRVEDALKELFSKTSEMIKEEDGKPPKKNTDKWDKYIKDTGLLTGLQGEQRELAKRAIEDALATQLSMEFKLQISSEKIGAPTKATDVKFGSEINRGLKGVELLYRRGVSQEIPKGKRYESLDSRGKPNYKMVMDDYGVYHIQSTREAIPNEDYRAIEAAMSQTSVPKNAETDQVPEEQKIKDEQAVELAKLLGFKEPITNEAEFRDNMLGSEIFVLVDNQEGEGQHYEMNIEMLNLTSVDQLNTLSHLSEFYTNMPILVESLNLTINEAGGPEAISTIQNFNIESLILSGPTSISENNETNIALVGGSCDYIEIRQGQFNISTNTSPIRVAMVEGDQAKASRMIFTENSLVQTLSHNEDIRTEFLMGENAVIQIEIQGEGPQGENKVIYEDSESHNVSKDNTGMFILIQENGQYKLVDSEHKFPGETIESNENLLGAHLPNRADAGEINELGLQILHEKMRNDVLLDADDRAVAIDMMTRGLGNRTATVTNIDYALKLYDDAVAQGVTIPAEISEVVQRVRVLESVKSKRVVQAEAPATELINAVLKIEYPEEGEAPPPPDPTRKTEEPTSTSAPQPAEEDTRTPLEKFKDDHKLKPQPTPEPTASTVEMNLPMNNLEVGQVYMLPDGREARYGGHVLGNFLDPDVEEHHYFLPVDGGEAVNLAPDAMVGRSGEPQLEEQPVKSDEAADLLAEQPSAAPQTEVFEEVHTDVQVPPEQSRRSLRELWTNRPTWLGGKRDELQPVDQGLTRAEVVRRRRQVRSDDSTSTPPSSIPVSVPQVTDSTLHDARQVVEPRLLRDLPPGERINVYKNELMRGKALPRFEQFKIAEAIVEECRQNGGEIPDRLQIALEQLRDITPSEMNRSQLFLIFVEDAQKLTIPEPEKAVKQVVTTQITEAPAADDTPDWLKAASPAKKIASADESSGGGGAAAEDDLDIPTWLKNRR